jgi:hypothetical protein
MDASLENDPSVPEDILKLIKDALLECRQSSSRLCGFARGLESGISTLQGKRSTTLDSMNHLQERSLRLSESRDDYRLGVAVGINLAIKVASAMFTGERATV